MKSGRRAGSCACSSAPIGSTGRRRERGSGKIERARRVSLPDGRSLGYARFGEPAGCPVFFMHGFPASRLEAELLHAPASSLGVSLIAPDRPGFGLSDPRPDRKLLDWPDDLAALADALGIGRFRVLGGSAGCPFALAAAHRLPDRVLRLAIVAGLGPTTECEVVRRMGRVARLGFALAHRAPAAFRMAYGGLAWLVRRYPELNFRLNEATPPDRGTIARPEVRAILDASIREAFRQGTSAAVQELALLSAPWGFAAEGVTPPAEIWHGQQDGVVPHQMGELLAGKLPNARLRLVAGEGHVSLPVRRGTDILKSLLASG